MRLSEYVGRSRTICPDGAVDSAGEQLQITYDPTAVSVEELYATGISRAAFLSRLVKAWTVTDEDDQPVPVTETAINTMLSEAEQRVLVALITTDIDSVPKEVMGRARRTSTPSSASQTS